jgi:hypothetical protein
MSGLFFFTSMNRVKRGLPLFISLEQYNLDDFLRYS